MKKLILGLAAAGLLLGVNVARADDDGHCVFQGNVVSISQIQLNVQKLGYNNIKSIKLTDNCTYKVKAYDTTSQKWELFFDPVSGNLIGKEKEGWFD